MSKEAIPFVDIAQFLSRNHEEWLLDGFFVTHDIYPYLQEQPNRISFYAIGLCQGGLCRTAIDLREYELTAGSFMALKPNQLVNLLEIRDYVGMLLIFDKHFFLQGPVDLELLESLQFFSDGATPVVRFEESDTKALLDEFINLRRRSTLKGHPYRREIARNLLVNLLYESDVLYRKQHPARDPQPSHKVGLTRSFTELLSRHFREEHEVQFYANSLSITPKYLSELLRVTQGKNASELIAEALATEAKLLLKNTSYTVAQIADLLHFSDAASFSHFFRKHATLSPLSYRKG